MAEKASAHRSMGTRIKELRTERGMSQRELAEILHTSKSAVTAYESNNRTPSVAVLILLADTFGVSMDYLAGRKPIDENKDKGYVSIKNLDNSGKKMVNYVIQEFSKRFHE